MMRFEMGVCSLQVEKFSLVEEDEGGLDFSRFRIISYVIRRLTKES